MENSKSNMRGLYDTTGYMECVKVLYDTDILDLEDLIRFSSKLLTQHVKMARPEILAQDTKVASSTIRATLQMLPLLKRSTKMLAKSTQ